MSIIEIYTNNTIAINGKMTGLAVTQNGHGTVVYTVESQTTGAKYKEHAMPEKRYALSTDKPLSGKSGRADFERDLLSLMAQPDFSL